MNKKIFLIFALAFLLVLPTVMAVRIDYSPNDNGVKDMKAKVSDTILFGLIKTGEQGIMELKSHKNPTEIIEVGTGWQVTMIYETNFLDKYPNALGNIYFYNLKNKEEIQRDYKFVYWGTETRQRDICISYQTITNSTNLTSYEECSEYGLEDYTYEGWLDYNSKDIPKGKITLGLMTYVLPNDKVDGVWEVQGKKIDKHAGWQTSYETDLVSWYKLDETSGTTATDSYGSNDGTASNADIFTSDIAGIINTGADFTAGTDRRITLFNFNADQDHTFSFWLRKTTNHTFTAIGSDTDNSAPRGFQIQGYADNKIGIFTGTGGHTSSSAPLVNGEWQHIAVIFSKTSGTLNVYHNGLSVINGTSVTYGSVSKTLGLGGRAPSGTLSGENPFNGLIDEIGIWSRTLSSEEVEEIYQMGLDGYSYGDFVVGSVILLTPENETATSNSTIDFSFNASVPNLQDIELNIYYENGTLFDTYTNNSEIEGIYNYSNTFNEGNYIWNVTATIPGPEFFYSENWTFTVDTTTPTISASLNTSTIYNYGDAIGLNYTITDDNLDTCWYNYGESDSIFSCSSGVAGFEEITTLEGDSSIEIWANDTAGNLAFEQVFFEYDTTPPEINISSPINSYDYLYVGQVMDLNFTANDTNLDSCWWNYNGTNQTISCSNGTLAETNFTLEEGNNNLTVYANDTLGNLGSETVSWDYKVLEKETNYDFFVTETENVNFNISINYTSSAWSIISSRLQYDGTNYSASQSGAGNSITFSRNLEIPTITNDTENKTFRWFFILTNSTGTFTYSSIDYEQNVTAIDVHICEVGEVPYLNFTTQSAENPFPEINGTIKTSWEVGIVGSTGTREFSYEDLNENISNWQFCITPAENYTINLDVEADATGYAKNFYYFENETYYVNNTQNESLYLLNDSQATPTTLRVKDRAQNRMPNVLIYMDLYDIGTNAYYNIGMARTNENGEDLVYLNWYDSQYRFRLYQDGALIYTTNLTKIFETPKIFEVDEEFTYSFDKFQDMDYSLTFNNLTNIFSLSFTKPSDVDQGCLRVIRRTAQNDVDICLTCSEETFATITCDISEYGNGTFIAAFYATGSWFLVDLIFENVGENFADKIYGLLNKDDSAFYAILLGGIVLAAFFITPVLGVIGMILGLLAISALGFAVVSYAFFTGIVILGVLIIWFLKS